PHRKARPRLDDGRQDWLEVARPQAQPRPQALTEALAARARQQQLLVGSLMVSTPPARPQSICPSAILLAVTIAASRLVPQARCRSSPGVCGSRPEDSTHSRVRL